MWWNTSTKILKRYTGSGWSAAIEDQKAIEAYGLAENAEDLADQKRRVFVATPYPPYDVGDLWDRGGAEGLWRCKTSRTSGSYSSTDWQRAADVTDEIVSAMAYEEMVSLAKLDSTIIQGGYIKTSLIQTGAIVITGLSGASTFTAYDTSRVAGTAASTIKTNAANGATFTSSDAGSLAYRNNVSTAQLDSTIISGGYIKTSLIETGAIVIGDLSGADSFNCL